MEAARQQEQQQQREKERQQQEQQVGLLRQERQQALCDAEQLRQALAAQADRVSELQQQLGQSQADLGLQAIRVGCWGA